MKNCKFLGLPCKRYSWTPKTVVEPEWPVTTTTQCYCTRRDFRPSALPQIRTHTSTISKQTGWHMGHDGITVPPLSPWMSCLTETPPIPLFLGTGPRLLPRQSRRSIHRKPPALHGSRRRAQFIMKRQREENTHVTQKEQERERKEKEINWGKNKRYREGRWQLLVRPRTKSMAPKRPPQMHTM